MIISFIFELLFISAKWMEWNWQIYCFHFCVSVCVSVRTQSSPVKNSLGRYMQSLSAF